MKKYKKTVVDRMNEINADFKAKMFITKQKALPYEQKKAYASIRVREFHNRIIGEYNGSCHVSVGGLDSIVLYIFIHYYLGYSDVIGISVSSLEDKSIQKIHKALGIARLNSAQREDGHMWNKQKIIQEFGFPVASKEIASKIEHLQNPTENNATIRHAIITGETGEYGGYNKNSRMKLSDRWLELFGGYENDNEGTDYQIPPFKVSSKCCYYLKEKPCDDWAKEHNSFPFLGLMASEGGRREKSLKINGCNYYGKTTVRSAPFAIFTRQDILKLALEMDAYCKESGLLEKWQLDTIIPSIYGKIANEGGFLRTTLAQRTGCSMCGFGMDFEKNHRPHRFDRLRERNYKEWEFWMYRCVTDPKNGEKYGWGKVFDYIGIPWEDEVFDMENNQINFFDSEV